MSRKAHGGNRLSQKSLFDFMPASSSPTQPSSSRPRRQTQTRSSPPSYGKPKPRKARAVQSSEESEGEKSRESSTDIAAIAFEPNVVEISDDEEAGSPRRPTTQIRSSRQKRADSNDGIESVPDSPTENVGVPVVWKGKGKAGPGKRKQLPADSDSEDGIRSKRRKLVKGERPLTPEALDLMDDLDEDKILDTRLRTRDKKSIYLQNLERMKRKKRGEKTPDSSESGHDDEPPTAPFSHATPGDDLDDDESHSDDAEENDTFIVEDDGNVPLELPTEFSMNTYQDLTHHFKIICQLFVHLAVQEKHNRAAFVEEVTKDQYFAVPLQIARRKIAGTKDSIVTSSVWRTEYKRPLETYPSFEVTSLQISVPACDACRLGGRISTLVGRLSGRPYDKQTFEDVTDLDDDSESSDEDDVKEIQKEFHLGRFCARRTRVFHEFTHWEYSLFHALAREVDDLRSRVSCKKESDRVFLPIAYIGSTKPPNNLDDADEVMAWLDSRQIIARELQKLNHMMERATNLEVASKRGEDDD